MHPFITAHASHPEWSSAFLTVAQQLDAQQNQKWGNEPDSPSPTLGFVYFTDAYSPYAAELYTALKEHWQNVQWVGTVGVGVAASGVEYFDEPGLVVMLTAIPRSDFQLFSGAKPLAKQHSWTALLHADPNTPYLDELITETSERTGSGYLFGGLSASSSSAWQIAGELLEGGLSGVAFSEKIQLISRVTQGSQPIGPLRKVTAADGNIVLSLDDKPAIESLEKDLEIDLWLPSKAMPRLRSTLVGLSQGRFHDKVGTDVGRKSFGSDITVRHLVGLDLGRKAIAVSDQVDVGMQLAFCARDAQAARRDLVRICSEIREEVAEMALSTSEADASAHQDESLPMDTSPLIAGAIYVSCSGRGGRHFGGPSAEMKIIQHALGDIPLVGFFAAGEIGHHHLYGYTGVLTVFMK